MQALGLNLDFLFGHGYLSARERALGDWATLALLRMEIPDLSFPFDARGGVDRFRNTRCHLRQIQLTVSESAFQAQLDRAMEHARGFEDLRVRFTEGAAVVSARYRTLGSDTFITFRVGVVPPEPSRGDALHLLIYDVRGYGPLPFPARLLVAELVGRLLDTPPFRPRGRGPMLEVHQEGDLLTLHPVKMAVVRLFPQHGWKIPSILGLRYEAISLQPGSLTLTARADGQPWEPRGAHELLDAHQPGHGAAQSLAAYEARELCAPADERLWSGELDNALEALRGLEDRYGLHPAVSARALDLLLASPGAGRASEARALVQRLLRADPEQLQAHLAAPTVALLRGDVHAALEGYTALAERLRQLGEREDLVCCLLALAMLLVRHSPQDAVQVLREVTQLAPRNRHALELLRDLYEKTDQTDELIDVLRRLAGLAQAREVQLDLFHRLARLLMRRRGDLGEARLYLEKILSLEPGRVTSLHALGESYLLDDQPMRALGAFNTAARQAAAQGDRALAARLHLRVAELWSGPLEDPQGALLASRRSLEQLPAQEDALAMALSTSLKLERYEDALGFVEALVPLREAALEQARDPEEVTRALRLAWQAHLDAAAVAVGRGRPDTASAHHRQALRHRRQPLFGVDSLEADPSVEFLDQFYRQMGRPEDLLDLYRSELATHALPQARRALLHRRLATIFDEVMGLGSEAVEQLRQSLELEPDQEEAVQSLVEIMGRDARHFELRDMLRGLLPRMSDRRARGLALRHLGQLHLEALPEPSTAASQLRQAQVLRPADPEVAALLVDAERTLRREDLQVDPRALLRALQRLAEVSPHDEQRREALVEAGDLCYTDLQRPEQAADLYRRAERLRSDFHTRRRLEEIHTSAGYAAREPAFKPAFARLKAQEEAPPSRLDVDITPQPPQPATPRGQPSEEKLSAFRERFQAMISSPASLEESRQHLEALRGPGSGSGAPEEDEEAPLLTTDQILESLHEELRAENEDFSMQELSPAALLEHELLEHEVPRPQPEPLPERGWSLDEGPREPAPRAQEPPPTEHLEPPTPDPASMQVSEPPTPQLDDERRQRQARQRDRKLMLADARESGDPTRLRDALEEVLDDSDAPPQERARFARELGLIYYYDLEQPNVAEERLRQAIELDPEGAGQDFDVLTALEGIYEDLGDPDNLLEIYRRKRHNASDPNMRQVYSLLIAELLWERLDRPQEASHTLEELLARDPGNVPARRMLADIARSREDTSHALELLREIVASQPDGSFELQEALRELGQVLIEHTARARNISTLRPDADAATREAVQVYRRLLDEVPGDSLPLGRLKTLLASLGEHEESLKLLGLELELILGRRGVFPQGPDPDHLAADQVPGPLHIPVSQILMEAAGLLMIQDRGERALEMLGVALALWPENVDALSLRLELGRQQRRADPEVVPTLIQDLQSMARLLLAPAERFPLLVEASQAALESLQDRDLALELLGRALQVAEQIQDLPPELSQAVERAHEDMMRLRNEDDAIFLERLVEVPDLDEEEPSDPEPPSHSAASRRMPRRSTGDTSPGGLWSQPGHLDPPVDPSIHDAETASFDALERPRELSDAEMLEVDEPPSIMRSESFPLTHSAQRPRIHGDLPGEDRHPRETNPFGFPASSQPKPPPPPPSGDEDREGGTMELSMPAIHLQELSQPGEENTLLDMLPSDGPQDSLDEALARLAQAESRSDRNGMLAAVNLALDSLPSDAMMARAVRRQLLVVRAEVLLAQRAPGQTTAATLPVRDIEQALEATQEALEMREIEDPEAYFLAATAHHLLGQRQKALDVVLRLARDCASWLQEDEGPLSLPREEGMDAPRYELERRLLQVAGFLLSRVAQDERSTYLARLRVANPRVALLLDESEPG